MENRSVSASSSSSNTLSNTMRSPLSEHLVAKNLHAPANFSLFSDPSNLLLNKHFTKSTAFSNEEREKFRLRGLLPAAIEDISTQVARCLNHCRSMDTPMAKYIYLSSLKDRNETVFYKLMMVHMEELLPFIYTPTVGQACVEFGLQFRSASGMYFRYSDIPYVDEMLSNWKTNDLDKVSVIVVSDGSRILGLGDLGANGMGIPIGKLSLYVCAGGFHPMTTLPVILDTGTNNKILLKDPFYLGENHERLDDVSYFKLVDTFLMAVKKRWPYCLVQFEDISNDHCFELLNRYEKKLLCFNDDIQGTGAVVAAGLMNAISLVDMNIKSLKIVLYGSGSAAIGVATQISHLLTIRYNFTAEECTNIFYLVDSRGLVTAHRGDILPDFKIPYARKDITNNYKDLLDIIQFIQPTVLIGLSGQSGAFSKEVLMCMAEVNDHPVIFSLSNPTTKSECSAEMAYTHTDGRCVFASGSPFPLVHYKGKTFLPSQGNNMYIFPGLGFGAWLGRCKRVSPNMITAASIALADTVSIEEKAAGSIYPCLDRARAISISIATAVLDCAFNEGLACIDKPHNTYEFVQSSMYEPSYV
ncbi:putative naDP-dependent malic enzyme [Cardiosporidium cionae]|uniref:Malic enzyme n=1 Tax=Cardiosporidium cionae TaxID=476202 RepID=A0ABQ7JCQ9_9APIC|nr:putative naDP-dependent malic enzyme [Cardiosporidium cionae]|eukprot:KAF8821780.1 putative naDP-dependent malic enzyme [Cardiosporidium cionae]